MNLNKKYFAILKEVFGTTPEKVAQIARGDSMLEEVPLKSELPGVSDQEWTQFTKALITSKCNSVSDSNALGMFELMPRRLADMGLVKKLARTKSSKGKTIWAADFVSPLSSDKFLNSPQMQYKVFCQSIRDYNYSMQIGKIAKPDDMPISGALAILHKAGPNGLKNWQTGKKFPATEAVYERASGAF